MYKNILVPTDFSDFSLKALRCALTLAKTFNAKVTILHAVPTTGRPPVDDGLGYPELYFTAEEYKKSAQAEAQEFMARIETELQEAHVQCVNLVVTESHPWRAIIETARSCACDLIVMTSHCKHGLKALIPGGETFHVLHELETPVLVCH